MWILIEVIAAGIVGAGGYIVLELMDLGRDVSDAMRTWTRDEGGE